MSADAPIRTHPLPVSQPPQPPPPDLPVAHFVAGLCWLLLGSAGLIVVAPELAGGLVFDPRVFAVTHAFTLGFLTTVIFGALHQLFPALLGVGIRSERAARRGFWALQAGVAALVGGFWFWIPALQGVGWVLLFAAVGVVSWNLLPQRRRARQNQVVGRYISLGHGALGLAMFLALGRIGEALGWWHFDRMGTIAAHFHLAALGFGTLTAVGIGSRILPMFLATDRVAEWPLRWIAPVASVGLLVFSAGAVLAISPLQSVGAALLLVATGLYLFLLAHYFHRRSRPGLDPALGHVAAASLLLGATTAAGMVLLLSRGGINLQRWAAYATLGILGWLVLFTLGVLYRIMPQLAWLGFYARAGNPRVRAAGDLTVATWAWLSLWLWTGGTILVAGGCWIGATRVALCGASGVAAAAGLVAAQLVRAFYLRRAEADVPSIPQPAPPAR